MRTLGSQSMQLIKGRYAIKVANEYNGSDVMRDDITYGFDG